MSYLQAHRVCLEQTFLRSWISVSLKLRSAPSAQPDSQALWPCPLPLFCLSGSGRHWFAERGHQEAGISYQPGPGQLGHFRLISFLVHVLHQLNGDDPISLLCWVTVRNSKIMCLKPLECYGTQRHSEFQLLCAWCEALLLVRHADGFQAISVSM